MRRTYFLLSCLMLLVERTQAEATNDYLEVANRQFVDGQYTAAIEDYTAYLSHQPHYPFTFVYERRAECYEKLGLWEETARDYSTAIELGATDCYGSRGDAYFELKRCGLAIADYNRAMTLFPHDTVFYESRGNVYQELRLYHQALVDYTKAIGPFGIDPDTYAKRGDVYLKLRLYDKAIADYTRAIDLRPNEAFWTSARLPSFAELWAAKLRFYPDGELANYYWKRATAYEAAGNSSAAERDRLEAKYFQP